MGRHARQEPLTVGQSPAGIKCRARSPACLPASVAGEMNGPTTDPRDRPPTGGSVRFSLRLLYRCI